VSGFLIDTNVISEFTKPKPDPSVIAWLQQADPGSLFASVITLGEIRLGIESMPIGKRRSAIELWITTGLPDWFAKNIIPVDRQIADRWGRLTIVAKGVGLTLTTTDGLIGATAIERKLALVTRNVKDFAGLDIALVNPWSVSKT